MIKIVGEPSKSLKSLFNKFNEPLNVTNFPLNINHTDLIFLVDPAQIQWVKALHATRKFRLVIVRNQEEINAVNFGEILTRFYQGRAS